MVASNTSEPDVTTELGPEYIYPICETHEDVLAARTPEQQKESDRRGKRFQWLIATHSREVELPAAQLGKETLDDLRLNTVTEGFVSQSDVSFHFHIADGFSICDKEGRHQQVKKEQIRPFMQQYANRCQMMTNKGPRLFDPSRSKTDGLIDQLSGLSSVYLLPKQAAPCALNPKYDGLTLIAVNNGLLDITDRLNPILLPHDRDYYTFHYLPYDYDSSALAPDWLWALGQYFQNDDGSPDTLASDILQGWLLQFLLNDISIQRIPTIIGEPRSGKGTIGRIIVGVLGEHTVTNLTTSLLAARFGLQGLIGKRLGIMWDAKVAGSHTDMVRTVEVLTNISGGDGISIERKYATNLESHQLKLNLLVMANKMMDLRDNTGALTSRWNILQTTGSFIDHVDPAIEERIKTQKPGILNLILRAKGGLMTHPGGEIIRDMSADLANVYLAFQHDDCCLDADRGVPIDVLWLYFCLWCRRTKHKEMSLQKFRAEIRTAGLRGVTCKKSYGLDINEVCNHYHVVRIDPNMKLPSRPYVLEGIDLGPETLARAAVR